MTAPPDATPSQEQRPQSAGAIIASLAGILGSQGFPRGDLAGLRRLDPDHPAAPAFWRLLVRVPEERRLGAEAERRWGLILHGMALMAPHHHDTTPVGRALFAADYSEARLGRLLDARGAQFRALVPRLCRQLAHKAQPLDWRELGRLILAAERDEARAEEVRLRIARAYYGAEGVAAKEHAAAAAAPATA
jgi:CRISPR system Cascade subunit CasB